MAYFGRYPLVDFTTQLIDARQLVLIGPLAQLFHQASCSGAVTDNLWQGIQQSDTRSPGVPHFTIVKVNLVTGLQYGLRAPGGTRPV
jgi:hypothetical protein